MIRRAEKEKESQRWYYMKTTEIEWNEWICKVDEKAAQLVCSGPGEGFCRRAIGCNGHLLYGPSYSPEDGTRCCV